MTAKVKCEVCGKEVAGRVPKGGDGSGLFPYRHKKPVYSEPTEAGIRVLLRYEWCEGSRQMAMWLDK